MTPGGTPQRFDDAGNPNPAVGAGRPVVLTGGRIHTLDPARPVAGALAIRGGRVVAAGTPADAWSAVGSDAPAVDLAGRTVLPGLVDAHIHLAKTALARRAVELTPDMRRDAVVERVRQAADGRPRGTWVVGRGWDHTEWGAWPTAGDLEAAAPDHPVCLTRKDGHVVWLNRAGLAAAGIGRGTVDPAGGRILRDDGEATGILLETAIELAYAAVPEPDASERRAALADFWPVAWRHGLVGCHDMGYRGTLLWDDLTALRREDRLGLRVVWYPLEDAVDAVVGRGLRSGSGDAWLSVGGQKLFLDGTLGSQTAHMLAPLEGQPGNRGLATLEASDFRARVRRAAEAGLATAVHAIGDAANRVALDGFAEVRAVDASAPTTGDPRPRLRHRIEHVQVLDPADIPRFGALGIVASMQPIHATADRAVADRYWGARAAHAYAWRSLLREGAHLAFGSDAPVETFDPFAGLHAAATRQGADGSPDGGWHPAQRLAMADALAAYTTGAAWAAGREGELGSLKVGQGADLIVVDRDPLAVAALDVLATRVLGTMIDGTWVWQSDDAGWAGPWRRPPG